MINKTNFMAVAIVAAAAFAAVPSANASVVGGMSSAAAAATMNMGISSVGMLPGGRSRRSCVDLAKASSACRSPRTCEH